MAACANEALDLVESLLNHWTAQFPADQTRAERLVIADYHFQRARDNFEFFRAAVEETGQPLHLWPDKLFKLYSKLQTRMHQAMRRFLRTLKCKKMTTIATAAPELIKAKPPVPATPPSMAAAPQRL